ncbi:hypothetical protein CL176_08195 [Suicoccus acidiformans]|uniref:DNA-directed RNA polymerase subunit beta n=1 Tax=Suicoccus acidiformans TaxID=2036206 RepID=A0A347WLM3_9LACT|nr:DNA-directed RNA polymerase subunit beta [Suicoccus acidiformans]AXY25980.1 hypothetical protein CL176_08195 [Suicoccus acidiformans]
MAEEVLRASVVKRGLKTLLQVILFVLVFVICVVLGLYIGYTMIGDGNFWEVFNRDTWQHIYDFIR